MNINMTHFKSKYKKQLTTLNTLINIQALHCLIISSDPLILHYIIANIQSFIKTKFDKILIDSTKPKPKTQISQEKTLHIVKIQQSKQFQHKIYTFLENSLESRINFTIFYSNQISAVIDMEKRVKSRFNNEVIYFEPMNFAKKLDYKNIDDFEHLYAICPLIQNCLNLQAASSEKLNVIKMDDVYEILTPVHLVMLLISRKDKLKWRNVISRFRLFCLYTPELRKVTNEILYGSFKDLLELRLIDGVFNGDWDGYEEFIKEKAPLYVRNLFK